LIAILEIVTFNLSKYIDWFNFYFPNPFYYEINDKVFKLMPIEIINYKFRSRASATFDNPLILATYLSITAPFCAYGSVYFTEKKSKIISRISFLFALGGLIFTSSRSAYIAIAIAIIILLISNKNVFKKLLPFMIIFAVAIPVGLTLRYKNTSVSDFFNSDSMRIQIWKDCFEMFLKNPILGLGAGTDNIHTLLRDTYGIINRTHAHNLFLEMLVEGGIIGGIFVISLLFILIKNLVKLFKLKDKKYKSYAFLYTASLLSFLVMSMSEFTLQSAKELMIFFILLGFVEATFRMATDSTQPAQDEIIIKEQLKETIEV
jgi:O-antigen ligase